MARFKTESCALSAMSCNVVLLGGSRSLVTSWATTWHALPSVWPRGAHCTAALGSIPENRTYCNSSFTIRFSLIFEPLGLQRTCCISQHDDQSFICHECFDNDMNRENNLLGLVIKMMLIFKWNLLIRKFWLIHNIASNVD